MGFHCPATSDPAGAGTTLVVVVVGAGGGSGTVVVVVVVVLVLVVVVGATVIGGAATWVVRLPRLRALPVDNTATMAQVPTTAETRPGGRREPVGRFLLRLGI
jgi:uncharacterized membrane protein